MITTAHGVSFVIPAYNEDDSIETTLTTLKTVLGKLDVPYEIILVNDGSKDKTLERAQKCGIAKIISHPINVGYGRSIKSGIAIAKYNWIGITDADCTYPMEKIPDLLRKMEEGFDMVIATRKNIGGIDSPFKNIFRKIFLRIMNSIIHTDIQDPNSGMRIFKKSLALSFFPFLCNTFSFTTSLTALAFWSGKVYRPYPHNI
jgi:glycosyltransferase involved in cell wall biosynthesis